jgi:hypothetical protein
MARCTAFQVEIDFCLTWVKPIGLAKPAIPRPYSPDELDSIETWRAYPKPGPDAFNCPYGLYNDKISLREIVADIVRVMLSCDPAENLDPGQKVLDKQRRIDALSQLSKKISELVG